jgi:hypothetical protein
VFIVTGNDCRQNKSGRYKFKFSMKAEKMSSTRTRKTKAGDQGK